jgi:acetyl esterase/lipase
MMARILFALFCWQIVLTSSVKAQPMQASELMELPQPAPDERVAYGDDPQQFGELYLPTRTRSADTKHPVIVLIHGGCWQAKWGLEHLRHLADALRGEGYAVWSLEYRRLGHPGGGWPGSCDDVHRGVEQLATMAERLPLDVQRVVVVGHSAGGQLSLWVAGHRAKLPDGEPTSAVILRGAIGLAPITDLARAAREQVCDEGAADFLGEDPERRSAADRNASPIYRLPAGIPLRLLCGQHDDVVPLDQATDYVARAIELGDDARLEVVPGIGHYELVAARGPAWNSLRLQLEQLLDATSP